MRIISKFHDYYDSAQSYGQDLSTVFVRKTEALHQLAYSKSTEFLKEWEFMLPTAAPTELRNQKIALDLTPLTVAFCGKIYHGVKIEAKYPYNPVEWTKIVYTKDDLTKVLNSCNVPQKDIDELFNKSKWSWRPEKNYSDFLNNQPDTTKLEKFITSRIPIMVCTKYGLIIDGDRSITLASNPRLQDLEFFRVFDPYQAFQELNMFISGTLAQDNKAVSIIPDKYKVEQHGFDNWSFRKQSTKGKQ